jgi:tripartite-type tricarboxylate transporter receptor subunit TctC
MISRRQLAALAVTALSIATAHAQGFPNRPVRIVVPFAAGGTGDVLMRSLQEPLQRHLGQPVVIENRLGASGSVGTQNVKQSAPDGYSLIQIGNTTVTTPLLQKGASYDVNKDFTPIALVATTPMVFLLNPAVPANSIAQLIAHAKANPGKLEFSSAGRGSLAHLATESFNQAAGISMVFVPYQGSAQAVTAALSGDVKVALTTPSDAINSFVSSGRLKMIGVSSAKRSPLLPDVPAIAETLPGFDVLAWFGVAAPVGTPPDVVAKLNDAFNKSIAEPAMQAKLKALGMTPNPGSAASFGALLKSEQVLWTRVAQQAKLEAE